MSSPRARGIAGLGVGIAAGAGARHLVRPVVAADVLSRENATGRTVQTASGLAPLVVALAAAAGPRAGAIRSAGVGAAGLGLAGLLDDLRGDRFGIGGTRGIRGHLGALRHGHVTTGVVKVVAGAVAGVGAVACLPGEAGSATALVADGAVVALAANLGNLLDRAPGRTTKTAVLATAALVATRRLTPGPALLVGATLATLPDDLGERTMLGDTGANLVGAAVGVAMVAGTGRTGRTVALAVLAALTLVSERRSFSAVIERTPALRALDRVGRRS
jgi:hypothetical protein